jgi:hypothetical protein
LELCCIKWMFWMTWLGHLRKKKLLMSLSASGPCSWARRFQWAFFLKKCWPIVQTEFYRLAADFRDETVQLKNINGSYITLVPKKQV